MAVRVCPKMGLLTSAAKLDYKQRQSLPQFVLSNNSMKFMTNMDKLFLNKLCKVRRIISTVAVELPKDAAIGCEKLSN